MKRDSLGQERPVTIVGAGFSGLVSALYLRQAGFSVEIVESENRAGGLIATRRTSFGLVESAANGLLNSAAVEDLFATVGVEVTPTLKEARKRYIFRDGRPRRWPLGIFATLRMGLFLLRCLLFREGVAPREQEAVSAWAERSMGKEAARYTVEAALQGIYAGDPSRMSARLIFGRFFSKTPSSTRARKPRHRGTVSAPEGMGQLIEALRRHLEREGVRFRFGKPMGELKEAPPVPHVIATSSAAAAQILSTLDPSRSRACAGVELLPVVSASVSFKEAPERGRGFGCLFPPVERRRALGVLMNNFIFPNRTSKGFSENWILGGAAGAVPDLFSRTDQEIVNLVAEERTQVFGARSEPIDFAITRWPRALPHYTLALEKTLPEMIGLRQNVLLIGNYLGQIGLAKILERAAEIPREIATKGVWK